MAAGARCRRADGDNVAPFADAQQVAERAYSAWGFRAPGPLHSERLDDYRARLLRNMLKHSKTFARCDLDIIRRDPVAFNEVERVVYADSIAASSSPDSVAPGTLRTVTRRLPSGHIENTFIGSPSGFVRPVSNKAVSGSRSPRPIDEPGNG
jgi:hypothetical protein